MKLPKGINHSIEHNPHAVVYETPRQYVEAREENFPHTKGQITEADLTECERTGEMWELQWYPETPIGFHVVAGPTLERVLELAAEIEAKARP